MARIALLLDFEPGHILPTFHLARSLQAHGHEVRYCGIPDVGPHVEKHGFEFEPLLADFYPRGSWRQMREHTIRRMELNRMREPDAEGTAFLNHLLEGGLDSAVQRIQPDLVLSSYFFSLETLILYFSYDDLPIAILTPFLRSAEQGPEKTAFFHLMHMGPVAYKIAQLALRKHPHFKQLQEICEPLTHLPELIACPRELELPDAGMSSNVRYIEPCVRLHGENTAEEPDFDWSSLPSDKRLIYASLGSQTDLYRNTAKRVYSQFFDMMRAHQHEPWHFVVSVAKHFDLGDFGSVPANATVCHWAPQLRLLERADAMLTHCGLGSVKECILHGVPMIGTPLERDQPGNAKRIEHHRLGLAYDPETVTAEELGQGLRQVLTDTSFHDGLASMADVFRQRQEAQVGARVIGTLLADQQVQTA